MVETWLSDLVPPLTQNPVSLASAQRTIHSKVGKHSINHSIQILCICLYSVVHKYALSSMLSQLSHKIRPRFIGFGTIICPLSECSTFAAELC